MKEYSYQERHMGTDVTISIVTRSETKAFRIAQELFKNLSEYEERFSRFLETSELSILNKTKTLSVSSDFMTVLKRSIELSELTDKAFNPLVQVSSLGYSQDIKATKAITNKIKTYNYNTDLNELEIDAATHTVQLAPDQQLDFGGLLKGYLANKLANQVIKQHPDLGGIIINIGGDIATRGLDEIHEPFIFLLHNPVTGEDTPVAINDKSLASSGTYARYWQTNAGEKHHIVDSQTKNNPTNQLVAVSIIHQDGAFSEALTKLFLVRGYEEAVTIMSPSENNYQYFCVLENGQTISNIV